MLAGILATVGSRPRGLTGEPEAEESSESLLIAESTMLLEKQNWHLKAGANEFQVILLWSTAPVVESSWVTSLPVCRTVSLSAS
jgi:hypothetical protein